jgi:hypothetical protein
MEVSKVEQQHGRRFVWVKEGRKGKKQHAVIESFAKAIDNEKVSGVSRVC